MPRPRTVAGKLHEMVVALRIEASLDKRQILEAYLGRVEFGPNLVGIQAASRHYFDKPALQLDLAEAAALVAIVRGPSFYDPRRGTELPSPHRCVSSRRRSGSAGTRGTSSSRSSTTGASSAVRTTTGATAR